MMPQNLRSLGACFQSSPVILVRLFEPHPAPTARQFGMRGVLFVRGGMSDLKCWPSMLRMTHPPHPVLYLALSHFSSALLSKQARQSRAHAHASPVGLPGSGRCSPVRSSYSPKSSSAHQRGPDGQHSILDRYPGSPARAHRCAHPKLLRSLIKPPCRPPSSNSSEVVFSSLSFLSQVRRRKPS